MIKFKIFTFLDEGRNLLVHMDLIFTNWSLFFLYLNTLLLIIISSTPHQTKPGNVKNEEPNASRANMIVSSVLHVNYGVFIFCEVVHLSQT